MPNLYLCAVACEAATVSSPLGTQRLLRVSNAYFVAGIVYEKVAKGPSLWIPVRAAPILKWALYHDDASQMATFLKGPAKQKGWSWEWLP